MTKEGYAADVEDQLAFRAMLFVPRQVPVRGLATKNNIKLYVRRDFLMDTCISGETLRQHKILRVVNTNLAKLCLEMIAAIIGKIVGCMMFHDLCDDHMHLGIHADSENRPKMAEFLRLHTLRSRGGKLSFKEYIRCMNQGKRNIFYLS